VVIAWVAWIFALITAAVHLLVFVFEAFLITRPWVHAGVFKIPAADIPPVRLWAFGVGFYNLFLGIGMVLGVIAWMSGRVTVGQTLVIYLGAFLALSGLVLFVADRMALSRPRGTGVSGAIGQAVPPLIALVATLVAVL
jgi:putative membrane protein